EAQHAIRAQSFADFYEKRGDKHRGCRKPLQAYEKLCVNVFLDILDGILITESFYMLDQESTQYITQVHTPPPALTAHLFAKQGSHIIPGNKLSHPNPSIRGVQLSLKRMLEFFNGELRSRCIIDHKVQGIFLKLPQILAFEKFRSSHLSTY